MNITLQLEGSFNTSASSKERHIYRKKIHKQLEKYVQAYPLWQTHDFKGWEERYNLPEINEMGFRPLVSEKFDLRAAVNIVVLKCPVTKPEKRFDLDNRLKILFDILKTPTTLQEIQACQDEDNPNPFYTLLEDDYLVDAACIKKSDFLFDPSEENAHPNAMFFNVRIEAKIYAAKRTELNGNFGMGYTC